MGIGMNVKGPLLLGAILCAPFSTRAATGGGGAPDSAATAPSIGGTRIVTSTFLPDPIVDTRVGIGIGYGTSSNVSTPLLEIGGEPVLGLEGSLLFAILGFDFRYAIRDRVAVWGRVNIAARLGSELQSVLAQGVNTLTGFELGWLARLWERERHVLSTAVMIRNTDLTAIDILGFARDVADGVPDPEIVESSPMLSTIVDLRYGYALNGCTALLLLGSVSYGEAVERGEENAWHSGAGVLATFDLDRRTGVPIGLSAGYKYSTIPEIGDRNEGNTQALMTGATYIGESDFSVGLELFFQRTPVPGSDDYTWFTSVMLPMQYYF